MSDSFGKKERKKKKAKKKLEKQARREDRKTHNDKGKSFDEMIMYVDEFGNLTDVPPEEQNREEIEAEDIVLGIPPSEPEPEKFYHGRVSMFSESKAYGFITEEETGDAVFVHISEVLQPIATGDRVEYKKEKTPKGFSALQVKKI